MSDIIQDDKVWFDQPSVLIKNYIQFVPLTTYSNAEKTNSIFRLSIIISILLSIYHQSLNPLSIIIITGIILYILYISNMELYTPEPILENCDDTPTKDNPFMNALPYDNPKTKKPACQYFQQTEDQDALRAKVNQDYILDKYQYSEDFYNKTSGQREFVTQPNTQIPSDQESFGKWLFKTAAPCKEGKFCDATGNGFSGGLKSGLFVAPDSMSIK